MATAPQTDNTLQKKAALRAEVARALALVGQGLEDRAFLRAHPHVGDLDLAIRTFSDQAANGAPGRREAIAGALWYTLLSVGQTRDVPARAVDGPLGADEPPRSAFLDAGLFPDKNTVEAISKILYNAPEPSAPMTPADMGRALRDVDAVILSLWQQDQARKILGPEEKAFEGLSVVDSPPSSPPHQEAEPDSQDPLAAGHAARFFAISALEDADFRKKNPAFAQAATAISRFARIRTDDPDKRAQYEGALWRFLLTRGGRQPMTAGIDQPLGVEESRLLVAFLEMPSLSVAKDLDGTQRMLAGGALERLWKAQEMPSAPLTPAPVEGRDALSRSTVPHAHAEAEAPKASDNRRPSFTLPTEATTFPEPEGEILLEKSEILKNFPALVAGRAIDPSPRSAQHALRLVRFNLERDGDGAALAHIAALDRLITDHAWGLVEQDALRLKKETSGDFRKAINYRQREAERIAGSFWHAILLHKDGYRLPDKDEAALVTALLTVPRLRATPIHAGDSIVSYRGRPGSTLAKLHALHGEPVPVSSDLRVRDPRGAGFDSLRNLRVRTEQIVAGQLEDEITDNETDPAQDDTLAAEEEPPQAPLTEQQQRAVALRARVQRDRESLQEALSAPNQTAPREQGAPSAMRGFFARAASVVLVAGSLVGLSGDNASAQGPQEQKSGFLARLSSVFKGFSEAVTPGAHARTTSPEDKLPSPPSPGGPR